MNHLRKSLKSKFIEELGSEFHQKCLDISGEFDLEPLYVQYKQHEIYCFDITCGAFGVTKDKKLICWFKNQEKHYSLDSPNDIELKICDAVYDTVKTIYGFSVDVLLDKWEKLLLKHYPENYI